MLGDNIPHQTHKLSLLSYLKGLLYKLVLILLNLPLLSFLFYKLFQAYVRIDNSHFSIKILHLLKSERIHLTTNFANLDFDVTYISYLAPKERKNVSIIHIYDKIIQVYSKTFSSYFYTERISEIDNKILDSVPELKDSNNHYCFLTSTAMALNSQIIVDIGTASGCSSIAFLLSPTVKYVHSFDIIPIVSNRAWVSEQSYQNIDKYLKLRQDNWTQYIADLTDKTQFDLHVEIFKKADVILIDIDHSGISERTLLNYLLPVVKKGCLIIWDDIRISTMQSFWEDLRFPKLDVGSIGHNSGTGISLLSNENYD